MKKFFRNNGLSIVFIGLFLVSLFGQYLTGWKEYNKERQEKGQSSISLTSYSLSGHFIQATFENWESEFLQMALFVVLTISLRQKGSSESKSVDGKEEVDREPEVGKADAPWPVRKGGWILRIYKHSLSIALLILFLFSFILHFYGSLKDENEKRRLDGLPPEVPTQYLQSSRFWFESFQNWQSEFLSVFTIVGLSIYLRQKGSPQSKPVDAPNDETGEYNLLAEHLHRLEKFSAMAKYSKKAGDKVEKAMHERKHGTLKSGRSGKKVTSRKQAIAIGL